MAKKNFQLTVILICFLYAQETLIFIINIKNVQVPLKKFIFFHLFLFCLQ